MREGQLQWCLRKIKNKGLFEENTQLKTFIADQSQLLYMISQKLINYMILTIFLLILLFLLLLCIFITSLSFSLDAVIPKEHCKKNVFSF